MYKDSYIISPVIVIQVRECSLGVNTTDACAILLVDMHVIFNLSFNSGSIVSNNTWCLRIISSISSTF